MAPNNTVLLDKLNRIYTKIEIIEMQVKEANKHLETQNGRIEKHEDELKDSNQEINDLKVNQRGMETKIWVFLFLGTSIGGLISAFLIKFLLGG